MSFLAKLFIDDIDGTDYDEGSDEGINVLHCTYEFSQPMDLVTGVHQGRVQAGLIRVDVESSKLTGLLAWMLYNQRGTGKIVFNSRDMEMSRDKEIKFFNASLVYYKETFDSINSVPMQTHLEIFARKIDVTDLTDGYEIEWIDEPVYE